MHGPLDRRCACVSVRADGTEGRPRTVDHAIVTGAGSITDGSGRLGPSVLRTTETRLARVPAEDTTQP
ncbi:hypothetical protein BB347_14925 [Natronorubrum daqingense]|uniref:Uncharacterized protein n=1 Tax=Natronorubrum daqingense TaxID=588898 RepID=A0A1P8RGL4_9EURY|nr:hypothetical protein BB347_14925 [Natronorubrum daqingense]